MDFHEKEIPREFNLGATTVRIHSQLAWMTDEQQSKWFQEQRVQNNPVLRQMDLAMYHCQTI